MKIISKSKYKEYKVCPKSLWLTINKPELATEDPAALKHIEDGKLVGSYAKQYFENTVDVTSDIKKDELDLENMIGLTNRYLSENDKVIAEATFTINGLFCSVDLLKPTEDGYEIYEVKATTKLEEDHFVDTAFQKYVLEQRGLKVKDVYVLHLDSDYIRNGDIEVDRLFVKEKVTNHPEFLIAYTNIKSDINDIIELLNKKSEPTVQLSSSCSECPFHDYCHKDVPTPSVFDINGLRNKSDYYNSGVVSYSDVLTSDIKLNKRQKVQIESYLDKKPLIVDSKKVKEFLNKIKYPVYHLDFESIQLPIPPADGCWPYEQIPTQYSLHIEYEDGRLEHKEFLGTTIDPRRAIAEALCRDIPMDACVTAYNKQFECSRLKELAELYEDLREHLLNIMNNVVDLLVPFKGGNYYHKDMGGSNSIKAVLPALYPNDPELDYHALPVVHNGGEAMDIYPKMLVASKEEKAAIREGLLQYCCLDTLAMVKVLRKLKEAI